MIRCAVEPMMSLPTGERRREPMTIIRGIGGCLGQRQELFDGIVAAEELKDLVGDLGRLQRLLELFDVFAGGHTAFVGSLTYSGIEHDEDIVECAGLLDSEFDSGLAFGRGGITDEDCHDLSWCDIGRSSLNL